MKTEIDHTYTICVIGTEARPHYTSKATMLWISSNFQAEWAVMEDEFAQNVKWVMTPGNRMMLLPGTAPGSAGDLAYKRIMGAAARAIQEEITAYEVVDRIRAEEAAAANSAA